MYRVLSRAKRDEGYANTSEIRGLIVSLFPISALLLEQSFVLPQLCPSRLTRTELILDNPAAIGLPISRGL